MQLTYDKGVFEIACHLYDNDLMRRLGLYRDAERNVWVTPWASVVKKLMPHFDDKLNAQRLIDQKIKDQKLRFDLSNATDSDIDIPLPPGKELRAFQRAGVKYLSTLNSGLLADDMGLGKTIQAIALCNLLRPKKVLIICMSSARWNWIDEWRAWSTLDLTVDLLIDGGASDVEIINHDKTYKRSDYIQSVDWDMVIVDETQFLKTPKARRTLAVYGGVKVEDYGKKRKVFKPIKAKYKLCLTGSPILNRPIEIYPTLHYLLPSGFKDKLSFARRYCGATMGQRGVEMNGSSNEEELGKILRSTIMIRRLKRDVLLDLPAKVRQIIEIDATKKIKSAIKAKDDLGIPGELPDPDAINLNDDAYSALVKAMPAGKKIDFAEVARIRKEEGEEMIPYAIEHLEELFDSHQKVICFFVHQAVGEALKKHFGDSVAMIYGKTAMHQRPEEYKKFQNDPKIRLFLGEYKSAGTSITLTAADRVVCAEFPWTPGEISQAEDRAHRIGQKSTVFIQHLVFRGSIGSTILKYVVRKQEIIEKALNLESDPRLIALLK